MEAEWNKVWDKIGGQIQKFPVGLSFGLQLLMRHCFEMGWKLGKKSKR